MQFNISCNSSKSTYDDGMNTMTQMQCINGNKEWRCINTNQLHREGAPARECKNGDKEWWQHGKLHREDGPAHERINACNLYWFQGTYYSNDVECWAHAVLQSRGTATCISKQDIDDFLRPILRNQVNKSL